jgi:hypothetical protein
VLLLPLLSLTYAVNSVFLLDPERVLFPVSVGFVLLCVIAAARNSGVVRPSGHARTATVLVVALLASSCAIGYRSLDYYMTQDFVLRKVKRMVGNTHAKSVRLRDYTGTLGDLYLLHPPYLLVGLNLRGAGVNDAIICTPTDVDRFEPSIRTLHQAVTTPRCERLSTPSKGMLVIDLFRVGRGLGMRIAARP